MRLPRAGFTNAADEKAARGPERGRGRGGRDGIGEAQRCMCVVEAWLLARARSAANTDGDTTMLNRVATRAARVCREARTVLTGRTRLSDIAGMHR